MLEIHSDSIFALTIKQPWASLIAVGVKTVKNRTWLPAASRVVEQPIYPYPMMVADDTATRSVRPVRQDYDGTERGMQRNFALLQKSGWGTMVVWECELADMDAVSQNLIAFLE